MNVAHLNNRMEKLQEKLSPVRRTREVTIIRQIVEPGVDAEGNSKPRKCGNPTTRTVILEI